MRVRASRASRALQRASGAALVLAMVLALPAQAANFGVSPLRVDLDRNNRTGVIAVTNEDPVRLQFQIRLFEWTQDAQGKDGYVESADLIYFPRLMTVEPKEKRLVRVGVKAPAVAKEQTYRLFIEEIPEPGSGAVRGPQVAVTLRIGVPVFVAPLKPEPAAQIEAAAVAKGELTVRVRNTGNQHVRIETVNANSGARFAKDIPGWYVLSGAAREFSIPIPAEVCGTLTAIEVVVRAEKLELKRALEVGPAMCMR